ncbi:type VI secretion system Vgr family protein [Sorangium sp. So ce363]|uniref:type VI secretion system Vgr family protein n=1 Tax=Sorangium sp. So ce363 TaxID=3133304 RepID=UPI003F62AB53
MDKDFTFAWEGASSSEGPWHHLEVLEFRGTEAINALYEFEIDLVRRGHAPDVDVSDLVGARAALRIRTWTDPPFRIIHGLISTARELGDVSFGTRYRVTLVPPFFRATMMKKSVIYLEKTLKHILEQALTRTAWGAGLTLSKSDSPPGDDGDESAFKPAAATYLWSIHDLRRLVDDAARPYCVQYQETDFAFIARLLEEEGISYHFEHTRDECRLVITDADDGRPLLPDKSPLGPSILGREVHAFQVGARVRPKAASLSDFNWCKPQLDLIASSPAGVTDFQVYQHPGRYEHSRETGEVLAEKIEQRFDTERQFASGEGHCRLLGAGTLFTLDHPNARWSGRYLVTAIRHHGHERGSFATRGSDTAPYTNVFEAIRCGGVAKTGESNFRPARATPRPRIVGSQTAIVTAEPNAAEAEINVGGPENAGCVRVRFHWDVDVGRHEKEATSCWVRVSNLFAGSRGHGAIWNPRVGDEVIVDFLEGDPDRPIVTGRVYNGANPAPENAASRPTYSALKSYTSPFDGNYNLLSFEDQKGQERIDIHAARDYVTKVKHNQSVDVVGSQSTSAGSISVSSGSTITMTAKTDIKELAGANMQLAAEGGDLEATASRDMHLGAGSNISLRAGTEMNVQAGNNAVVTSPWIDLQGGEKLRAGAAVVEINAGSNLNANAAWIDINGSAKIRVGTALYELNAATVLVNGGAVSIQGDVKITGGTVDISGSTVTVTGGTVKLNC